MQDKRGIAALILGTANKPSKESRMESEALPEGNDEASPAPSAKAHAAKKFFKAASAGEWERAASALQNFIDICNYEEDDEEEDDSY